MEGLLSDNQLRQMMYGSTKHAGPGWRKLKDSDIFEGCKRTGYTLLKDYNQEWVVNPLKNEIVIVESEEFIDDLNKENKYIEFDNSKRPSSIINPEDEPINMERLNSYIDDLKKGYLSIDNYSKFPRYPDCTHYLADFSKRGEYLVYSKDLTSTNRLTYIVYKPIDLGNGKTRTIVELSNCRGHRFRGIEY